MPTQASDSTPAVSSGAPAPSAPPTPFIEPGATRPTHAADRLLPLALAALGVVYGDIGTSPLYAIKECFHGLHALPVTPTNILGVLSLVFWALTVVVTIKYVLFIMRADNDGEGGIFALLALLRDGTRDGARQAPGSDDTTPGGAAKPAPAPAISRFRRMLPVVGIFGAALLYGDGVITPAISVLSAVEGLEVATEAAAPFVLPITIGVLVGLFMAQRHGTERIGRVFGPVMVVWFAATATLGLMAALRNPQVFAAISPAYAVRFFMENHLHGIVVLGSVVLCITGGEALYADMGHFGARPIRLSWMAVVFPALMFNYLGQGAVLLADPELSFNPFFALVPRPLLYPMVALSTVATVIASQAMISGVYSLTQQGIQLGFVPRMRIIHTSEETRGQIYLPGVNWLLMIACVGLVLAFRESSRLAGAYGIAVTATMGMTSLLYYAVARQRWGWRPWQAVPLVALFLAFDAAFLSANLLKIMDGGWFTLLLALGVMTLMLTWRDGRAALSMRFAAASVPFGTFLDGVRRTKPLRVPGTAVFMSVNPTGTPLPLLHHYKHNHTLHQTVVLLTIVAEPSPFVPRPDRLVVHNLGEGFHRMVARYGFMQTPRVPELVQLAAARGLPMRMETTTFFVGRETLLIGSGNRMAGWRKALFAFMSRNAWNATTFFGIPPGRVIEIGAQVEL
uniref:Probable potassium transport system protein Kup n=1 Tax=Nitratidesulfovibrio vulgaris (strain DSM 19637 / Miyazaki F) TaxID=883 RepID=B8DPN3_NITV9